MTPSHSSALPLPWAGRPRDTAPTQPKTPEPFVDSDGMQRPPSPPRPKFKLKRRVASNLNAPTQQFLASVAAADVPIPSIEEPSAAFGDASASPTIDMDCSVLPQPGDSDYISLPRGRRLSSPRTPAPGLAPSLSPRRYPDWTLGSLCSSVESTPDCESSRPSTAVSTQTSASLLSRYSIASEDLQCPGPNPGESGWAPTALRDGASTTAAKCDGKRKRAKWTAPMTNHLWSTYCLYLRDPKVTPIRFSKSGIPPQGVCCRVAREAKRSWRGANPQGRTASDIPKSRNATPTREPSATFMQWPHTGGATRAHLRELCKYMSSSPNTRAGHHHPPHTPTSLGRTVARLRRRRTTPTSSAFSSKEMCMSLALSTCESMQPSGPLAQLTQATPEPAGRADTGPPSTSAALEPPALENRRLASPFTARSYGPSSSAGLGVSVFPAPPQRQPHTVGAQHALQSPARLTRSRSNTQKRRPRQPSAEPRRTKRPSLGSDLWVRPTSPTAATGQLSVDPSAQFSSSSNTHEDVLCVPRTNLVELLSGPSRHRDGMSCRGPEAPGLERSSLDQPPRLGSPFTSSNTSFSFPNRLFKREPLSTGATIRPFATFQRREDAPTTPSRDLDGRMAYLDQRLRELRQNTPLRKRSESPF